MNRFMPIVRVAVEREFRLGIVLPLLLLLEAEGYVREAIGLAN
jgi:hypothetical protein